MVGCVVYGLFVLLFWVICFGYGRSGGLLTLRA